MDKFINRSSFKLINSASLLIIFGSNVLAQGMLTRPAPDAEPPPVQEDSTLYYVILFVLLSGLAAAVVWWYKTKKAKNTDDDGKNKRKNSWEVDSLDADKELEWMRKHSKAIGKKDVKTKKYPAGLPRTSRVLNKNKADFLDADPDDSDYQDTRSKLNKIKFDKLPINSFTDLKPAKTFDALPLSNDDALMSAVEQTQDEYEEDVEVRDLAVRILARFRTRNSVEALSQVALYDLSANLRSKAITTLAEFDHESVFETILLGCADPTREVRAASAKALFQLSFNRADAWARIAQSGDEYRIVQAAKAAIESDLVERSIDRLIHDDHKYAYEAFTLLALLVIAGETREIFQSLENHRDNSVKLAVLKVLKVLRDERVLPGIYFYMERNSLPEDLSNAANEVIKACDLVPA